MIGLSNNARSWRPVCFVPGACARSDVPVDGVGFVNPSYPVLRPDPEVGTDRARFVQTVGGATGLAAPRRLGPRGSAHIGAPPAWTTLTLTLHADGRVEHELVGASPFPRHWLYDATGLLRAKTALIEFDDWFYRDASRGTPWGGVDTPALVAAAESALERKLSAIIVGSDPPFRRLRRGEELVREGEEGGDHGREQHNQPREDHQRNDRQRRVHQAREHKEKKHRNDAEHDEARNHAQKRHTGVPFRRRAHKAF